MDFSLTRVPAADRRTMRRVDHNPRGSGTGRHRRRRIVIRRAPRCRPPTAGLCAAWITIHAGRALDATAAAGL